MKVYQGTRQGTTGHSRLSQLVEPPLTDPGLKSGIGVRELISTLKEIAQARKESSRLPTRSSNTRKKPLPSYIYTETYNVQRDIMLPMMIMMMMITLMMTIMLILTLRRWIHAHSSSASLPLSLPCSTEPRLQG